jgi:hypothetical protein
VIQQLATSFLTARRKGWLRSSAVVTDRKVLSAADVEALESSLGCLIPGDMREWLMTVGFCTLDDQLNFQSHWFKRIDQGHLAGAVIFAQDELGSFYAYLPDSGRVVYFARSEPAYAVLAESFGEFLEQLQGKDYQVVNWVESLKLLPYEWNAV